MVKKTKAFFMISMLILIGQFVPVTVQAKEVHNESIHEHTHDTMHHLVDDYEIQPMVQACFCGEGFYYPISTYDAGERAEEVRCTHGKPFGTDKAWIIETVTEYRCNRCGSGFRTIRVKSIRYDCHGYY